MDRTIGKSENRNNDGEGLMISLLEIAKSINEVDDDKIIKYRDKEGESQEMPAGSAKKLPKDHPAKIAYDTMAKYDDYQNKKDDSEKDAGDKLGGSDFDRDGGDDKPSADDMDKGKPNEDDDDYAKMTDDAQEKVAKKYGLSAMQLYDNAGKEPEDFNSWEEYENHLNDVAKDLVDKGYSDPYADEPDDDMDDDDMDDEKSSESENEDIISGLEDLVTSSKQKFRYFDIEKEDSEIDSGRYAVVRGNVKDDPDQHMSVTAVQDGDDIAYSINIGIGGTPIYFDSKEEAMEAAKKLLDDEKIRDTMNGDEDEVLADLDQYAKDVLKGKSKSADSGGVFRTGKELDNETITINGQKYRAIKEEQKKSNPRVLKEIYDRTFRSLK